VTPRQQLSPDYVYGVSCPHCAGDKNAGAKAAAADASAQQH
jgi:UPF0176 protein